MFLPPTGYAKVMFLQVSVCPQWGGCMVAPEGHVWLLQGVVFSGGGMHGFFGGGGMHGFCPGGGGMHGFFWGGMHGFCLGGMRGFCRGHAWFFLGGCAWYQIRSMSGRCASYWNAFLFTTQCLKFHCASWINLGWNYMAWKPHKLYTDTDRQTANYQRDNRVPANDTWRWTKSLH